MSNARGLRRFFTRAVAIIRRPSQVTCLECGFLAFGNDEASTGDRWMLATKGRSAKMPSLETLRCRRSLWSHYEFDYFGNSSGPKLDVVNEPGRCPGFRRYRPGLSPEEHMQRVSKAEERKAQFGYTLLAAVLASVLTLLGAWAAKYLGGIKP